MKTATLKMETTLYFPLLLLLCSLCSSEEHDNEIISVREQAEPQGRDLTNASDRQQACPRDIHNVLREMSALLAEQRVEIKHLQKDNEGTTVCEVVRSIRPTVLQGKVFTTAYQLELKPFHILYNFS